MLRSVQLILDETKRLLTKLAGVHIESVSASDSSAPLASTSGCRVLFSCSAGLIVMTFDGTLARAVAVRSGPKRSGESARAFRDRTVLGFCDRVSVAIAALQDEGNPGALIPPVLVGASAKMILPQGTRVDGLDLATESGLLRVVVAYRDEEAGDAVSTNGRRVLVIDDDPFVRKLLSKILRDMELEVRTAESGQQGLDILTGYEPDIVLLDFEMPGMNGLACLPKVCQLMPKCRVVMLTARGSVDTVRECVSKGASGFIAKTCRPPDLRRHITRFLTQKSSTKETNPLAKESVVSGSL